MCSQYSCTFQRFVPAKVSAPWIRTTSTMVKKTSDPYLIWNWFIQKWNFPFWNRKLVRVTCRDRWMTIHVQLRHLPSNNDRTADVRSIESLHLQGFGQLTHCQPKSIANNSYTYRLPLDRSEMACGLIREMDYELNEQRFKHRILVFGNDSNRNRTVDALQVRCVGPIKMMSSRYRRAANGDPHSMHSISALHAASSAWDELPPNFTESSDELLDYSGNVTANGPRPEVRIAVRQSGKRVDGTAPEVERSNVTLHSQQTMHSVPAVQSVTVQPGTPLELSIYLAGDSTNVYGLLCSQLKVADRLHLPALEEPLLANGCSLDPYLFGNFESADHGKSISARFRAFKFPDSSFVLFIGRVHVCLNTCQPVHCDSDDRKWIYGRKRRKRNAINYTHLAFEVQMSAIIQVESLRRASPATIRADFECNDCPTSANPTGSLIMSSRLIRSKKSDSGMIHQLSLVNASNTITNSCSKSILMFTLALLVCMLCF